MSPFQRAREEAIRVRETLLGSSANEPINVSRMLSAVESKLDLAVEEVDSEFSELAGGSAVLKRNERFIYLDRSMAEDKKAYLIAHELGHWVLDAERPAITIAHLSSLTASNGSPGVAKVEAYGARERQELQANVFARELLLPRSIARAMFALGKKATDIADELGVPLECVRLQLLDALLLPESSAEPDDKPLPKPSPDQQAAAEASARYVNVVAGPGTGKTSTLIHRVKHLIEAKGVDPSRILVLTFTNKAAFELVERLRSTGIERAAEIWAGTFHAFGLEFLRKYHQCFNLDADLVVADKLNTLSLLVRRLPHIQLGHFSRVEDPYEWMGPVISAIKRLKEELVSPSEYKRRLSVLADADDELKARRSDVAALYEAHESVLGAEKIVDFVDLVAKPALALKEDRSRFSELTDRFQHVLVDEYQDVTFAMVELVRQLSVGAQSLWVVGDVRQAIHHWRGASVKSLIKFEQTFKGGAAGSLVQKYPLDVNRRSSQEILDLVVQAGRRHVLEPNLPLDAMHSSKGPCGNMPSLVKCATRKDIPHATLQGIKNCISKGISYRDQAVLCRKNADVDQMADALRSFGIPVLYIGELIQRPEIRRLVCLMQLLAERQPRTLVGLVDYPGTSLSLNDINVILKAASEDVRLQRGKWLHNIPPQVSAAGAQKIANVKALIGEFSHRSSPWDFVCDLLFEKGFSLPDIGDDSLEAHITRIALWQFAYSVRNGSGDFRQATLSRYLLQQKLRQRIGESYVDRELPPEASTFDAVKILSVHSSKGLEYEAVHVGFLDEDSYGSKKSPFNSFDSVLDVVPPEVLGSDTTEYDFEMAVERNNLLYVALSRGKSLLYLYTDIEFGIKLPEAFQHYPPPYNSFSFSTPPVSQPPSNASASSGNSFPCMPYEEFYSYAQCPLQHHYKFTLNLKSEQDADVAVRARWAVMEALKTVADGGGDSSVLFNQSWQLLNLPSHVEDPGLWTDATSAFSNGLVLLEGLNGRLVEPTTVIGGLSIKLPWALSVEDRYSTTFHLIRFSSRGTSTAISLLRPMLSGMNTGGSKAMFLHNLLSSDIEEVKPSGAPMKTNAVKAAIRLIQGDTTPSKGRHCGHCAYLTICPSLAGS